MPKYLLIGLGVLLFLAMAVGDGLGIMAYLKLRSLPVQSAAAHVAGGSGSAAGKAAAKPTPKAPPRPTAENANFVEIPQFVVTIPARAPNAGTNGNAGDANAADGSAATAHPAYLQLSLSFLTESQRAAKDFAKLMPMIKSAIISDVMSSGLSPNGDPVKMKHQISEYSLQAANTIVSQADAKVGKTPFVGAYVTTFVTQ
ncbi:hypothetical protein U879_11805 [Defluviimonas sp. 20V17]|uniref:Uncharacterized protein n=1 Tax=Allgaiera indica TaxID=765699 RepID=A0AAN4ZX13_9RHOB|nr:flagellar basal body-associated FliL family protein [Allgaiera indica]KDB03496.1 hypothetical protein U879_11805 [Defluviimonas sp. 20V17]GHD98102.1 hypothetical protein GCM10008024_00270 [Allgaiera indica]SDW53875.1 hypothetical protein SAMN05444006_104190 [Allgaiera indica]